MVEIVELKKHILNYSRTRETCVAYRKAGYSKKYFEELIQTGKIKEIHPSDVWYEERTAFDETQIGQPRIKHNNTGYELIQGPAVFEGKILGGCIKTFS